MLNDLQSGIFSELRTKKAADTYRRSLQKSYVDKLSNILNPPAPSAAASAFGGGDVVLQTLAVAMLLP